MTRHLVIVDDHGDHVHVDLSALPAHVRQPFLGAITTYGTDELAMQKAVRDGGEGPDPRYPDLNQLIDNFRATWSRWANWLADRVTRAIHGPEPARDVADALRHHDAGVTAETSGAVLDPSSHADLVARGLIPGDHALTAPIPAAALLGMARDSDVPHRIPTSTPTSTPTPTHLTPQQLGALTYVRDRAAIFMSRPISGLHAAVRTVALDAGVGVDPRTLSPEERAIVGTVIAQGITERLPSAKVAQRLRDAVQGTGLTNDMDRVAVTEMAFAHNHGALVTLKGKLPPGADPLVYKIVSPGACDECRRIWGPSANPIHYRLSIVEAGNNFRKPPKAWGPTVGPVHPNCFPAGVPVRTSRGDLPIERVRVGDLVLTHRNRWRRVMRTFRSHHAGVRVIVNGVHTTGGHPFLTTHGWVAAGDLVVGDELVQPGNIPPAKADNAPTILNKIRRLLLIARHFLRRGMPVSAVDLQCNEFGGERQVDQVSPHLIPRHRAMAAPLEFVEYPPLQIGAQPTGVRGGHPTDQFLRLRNPTDGVMSGRRVSRPLLRRSPGGREALRRAGVSLLESESRKPQDEHLSGHAHAVRAGEDREPLLDMEAKQEFNINTMFGVPHAAHAIVSVLDLSTVAGAGTVYNLSVDADESYVAGGYVVHNCTCPPLLRWDPAVHDAVQDVAEELRKQFDGKPRLRHPR